MAFDREDAVFKVLANGEEQISPWPECNAVPAWLDIRPLELPGAAAAAFYVLASVKTAPHSSRVATRHEPKWWHLE